MCIQVSHIACKLGAQDKLIYKYFGGTDKLVYKREESDMSGLSWLWPLWVATPSKFKSRRWLWSTP